MSLEPLRSLPGLLLCLALAAAPLLPGLLPGQRGTVPVTAKATVDATELAATGRARVVLEFTPHAAPGKALAVRLELRHGPDVLLSREHGPKPPTLRWVKGKVVRYEIPLVLPIGDDFAPGAAELQLYLGFVDRGTGKVLAPRRSRRGFGPMILVATLQLPPRSARAGARVPDAAQIDRTIAEALAKAKAGRNSAAWEQLEFSFRQIEDYPTKARLRQALAQAGRFDPPPLTLVEEAIVARRIAAERRRYLRQVAGSMSDRRQYHGALLLLEEIGGKLREEADKAHIGALADVKAVTKSRQDLIKRILNSITDAEMEEVHKLREDLGETTKLLEQGMRLWKKKQWPKAREILLGLCHALADDLRNRAMAEREKLEAAWIADVPDLQRRLAQAAMNHPVWARTKHITTHKFIIIGPEVLVQSIPKPSCLRFDLAYVYITDLFGRVPNPAGDRVTVYYKELWNFGGGIGGGKIIDIGKARPDDRSRRLDTGLLYHEFTHCTDDTSPICGGFREGLADFSAAFAYEALGQRPDIRRTLESVRRAFTQDYLERDLEFWRIPNYAPSAGFFLHFIDKYGRGTSGHRWELYRRFFRSYRQCRVKDARTPTVARAIAHHMMLTFGTEAFDDMVRFRFPLVASDKQAVVEEHCIAAARERPTAKDFEQFPGSPVPRDVTARGLVRSRSGIDDYMQDLGIVKDWWVIGPFKRKGRDSDTFVFPPEYEVDLKKIYPVPNHNVSWRRPGQNRTVTLGKTGWLKFDYTYMDYTAIYALTHVHTPREIAAVVHLRADDDVTLFVNDALVGKYRYPGRTSSGPWRPSSRHALPDAIRFKVRLQAGRNKILVKTHNREGASGCIMAVSTPDGKPLQQWSTDSEPPKRVETRLEVPKTRSWKQRVGVRFEQRKTANKWQVTVGRFRVRNRAFEGTATDGKVPWRKYTIRPGFKRDSPSNLAWLTKRLTKDLTDFHLTLDLDCKKTLPKLCVILQGEGGKDPLSGWTLILTHGRGKVQARLERYDRLVYQSDRLPVDLDAKRPVALELLCWNGRLTARLGKQVLLDQVPLRAIADRNRIGIATWGPQTKIIAMSLRTPRGRTR